MKLSNLTKAELVKMVLDLKSKVADQQTDIDYMNENYYCEEQIQDMIREAIQDHDESQLRDLQRYEPETHRQRFQLINGGAA